MTAGDIYRASEVARRGPWNPRDRDCTQGDEDAAPSRRDLFFLTCDAGRSGVTEGVVCEHDALSFGGVPPAPLPVAKSRAPFGALARSSSREAIGDGGIREQGFLLPGGLRHRRVGKNIHHERQSSMCGGEAA